MKFPGPIWWTVTRSLHFCRDRNLLLQLDFRFSCIYGTTVLCSTDRVGTDGRYFLLCLKEKLCESLQERNGLPHSWKRAGCQRIEKRKESGKCCTRKCGTAENVTVRYMILSILFVRRPRRSGRNPGHRGLCYCSLRSQ